MTRNEIVRQILAKFVSCHGLISAAGSSSLAIDAQRIFLRNKWTFRQISLKQSIRSIPTESCVSNSRDIWHFIRLLKDARMSLRTFVFTDFTRVIVMVLGVLSRSGGHCQCFSVTPILHIRHGQILTWKPRKILRTAVESRLSRPIIREFTADLKIFLGSGGDEATRERGRQQIKNSICNLSSWKIHRL